MISIMANNASRSAVFYVWDNGTQNLVGLYRAVRPEDLAKRPMGGFDGYFSIEQLSEFVAGLRKTHVNEDFVIRDWIAESAQDFYRTRLGWTDDDVAKHLPPNRAGSAEGAPAPVLRTGGADWGMTGIEVLSNTLGIPAGVPIEKARVMAAMKAYSARRGPGRGKDDSDVPMHWFRLSTESRLAALKVFDRFLDEDDRRFEEIAVPRSDEELYRALHENSGDMVRLHDDPSDNRYYFQTREAGDLLNEWWIGSHRDELMPPI